MRTCTVDHMYNYIKCLSFTILNGLMEIIRPLIRDIFLRLFSVSIKSLTHRQKINMLKIYFSYKLTKNTLCRSSSEVVSAVKICCCTLVSFYGGCCCSCCCWRRRLLFFRSCCCCCCCCCCCIVLFLSNNTSIPEVILQFTLKFARDAYIFNVE